MHHRTRRLAHAAHLLAVAIIAFGFVACADTPVTPDFIHSTQGVALQDNTLSGDALHPTSTVFPSTNEANIELGWANVQFVDVEVGSVTLAFDQPRNFFACFEYRRDEEDPTYPDDNFNTDVTDGLWSFTCLNGNSEQRTITANSTVDIRMAFGAETDERFDWTRFYVLSLDNKDQCKDGKWQELGFRNQGQCVRFVETGRDSRTDG
ncbi:MAG: hypothetical protein EA351_13345 [Gemmatimonadales bacterium]|nr:MAG: hypothetical protein EA351_13345 [Gemmatimonadales bacterium]